MKQLATILLLSATLLQPLQSFWVRISFELNRTYIANNLCENKLKPELKCGGQCYLMKKLAEKQKQQQENNSERVEMFVATPFFEALPNFVFKNTFTEKDHSFTPKHLSFLLQECILSTFRPPCA